MMTTKWKVLTIAAVLLAVGLYVQAQQPVSVANTPSVTVSGTAAVTQSGTWTVQPGNTANTTPWLVAGAPTTGSGSAATAFHVVGSTSTYNTVKGSAGNLYGLDVFNPNSTPCYLMVYNSTSPTIGTTGAVYGFGVQAGTSKTIAASTLALGNFSTGITVAGTTTDGGASVCSTGMSINAQYN